LIACGNNDFIHFLLAHQLNGIRKTRLKIPFRISSNPSYHLFLFLKTERTATARLD